MIRPIAEIADELRGVAPGNSDGERAVRQFADTLEAGSRADLAGVDLAGAHDPETMLTAAGRWPSLLSVLELGRDSLIFVPVIYTWFAIADALRAYRGYAGSDPFLVAWENGFGKGKGRLSDAAVVVAWVVLTVVVLIVVTHLFRNRLEARLGERRQRLAALLAEASLYSAQSPMTGDVGATKMELAQIGAKISDSAEALQKTFTKASEDITGAVNTSPGSRLNEMFEQWVAAARELSELGKRLKSTQEVAEQLSTVEAALTGFTEKVQAETQRMLNAFADEREATLQATHAQNRLAADVQQATTNLGTALTGLSDRAEEFNEMVHRLTFLVQRIESDGQPSPEGMH